jgi:hypothetical protein
VLRPSRLEGVNNSPGVNKGAEHITTTALRVHQLCAFLLHRPVRVSDANDIATHRYDLIKPRTMRMFTLAWSRDTCIYNSTIVLQVSYIKREKGLYRSQFSNFYSLLCSSSNTSCAQISSYIVRQDVHEVTLAVQVKVIK